MAGIGHLSVDSEPLREPAPAIAAPRLSLRATRLAVARVVEWAGLAFMALLVGQILFAERPSLDLVGAAVGVLGIAAALTRRESLRTPIDAPLLVYVSLALVSTVVNHGRFIPTIARDEPATAWQPALELVALALYFYGASRLLATERRLGLLVTVLVAAFSVFGVQAAYVHARVGFEHRLLEYPYLVRWSGYAPLGLLFALGFALTVPVIAIAPSWLVVGAAAALSVAFFVDSVGVYSRAATIAAIVAYVCASTIEIVRIKTFRLAAAALLGSIVIAAAVLPAYPVRTLVQFARGDFYSVEKDPTLAYKSRFDIWRRASGLVRQEPWLGVGSGRYSDAMRRKYSPIAATDTYYHFYTVHAHNAALQVAAESGIPAAIAFLFVWWTMLKGLIAACRRDYLGTLALGFAAALIVFFVKSLLEHLLSSLDVSTRISFLLWTLFAAGAAVVHVRRQRPAAGSG